MIQFNLLPDVKLEFIRAQRLKRTVLTISIIVSSAATLVLGMLFFTVNVLQRTHMNNLDNDIKTLTKKLESDENLNKVLTIQNQLVHLETLHQQKPETSRALAYIKLLEPADEGLNITYDTIEIDFTESTIVIKGQINTSFDFNKLVDAYKFAEYAIDGEKVGTPFSQVETSQSFESQENDIRTTFELSAIFDPAIFDNTQNVEFVIDNKITTRSEIDKPTFEKIPEPENTEEGESEEVEEDI